MGRAHVAHVTQFVIAKLPPLLIVFSWVIYPACGLHVVALVVTWCDASQPTGDEPSCDTQLACALAWLRQACPTIRMDVCLRWANPWVAQDFGAR